MEAHLFTRSLQPLLEDLQRERERETGIVEKHVETSLNMLLTRENPVLAELVTRKESGSGKAGLCEFEALVLSDPDSLLGAYLEEINDSHQTAPSKRLLSYLSDYSRW